MPLEPEDKSLTEERVVTRGVWMAFVWFEEGILEVRDWLLNRCRLL